jgi:hypothetical protein
MSPPSLAHTALSPAVTTHNQTAKLNPGGAFGIAQCDICLPLSTKSGVSTPSSASVLPTTLSPHNSIAQLSPFEMDFARPPKSPFVPPDPSFVLSDQTDPPNFDPSSPVSPSDFAAVLRLSMHAFHAMASAHKSYMATTTEERLNTTPQNFALQDRVKIYVPPHTRADSTYRSQVESHCCLARTLSRDPFAIAIRLRS